MPSNSTDGFVFTGLRSRAVFGAGRLADAGPEIERLGRSRALILSTAGQARAALALAERLGPLAAGTFAEAAMHTPTDVTERAIAAYEKAGADCVVAIGGGSAIGLGKAIAVRTGADQVAIPTTYAGSEMTDILGETEQGRKTTRRDPSIQPETVIYDVTLTLGLPTGVSIVSGLNAMAHAAEGLYAVDRHPLITLMATDALRRFRAALPAIARDPGDIGGRTEALHAAWLCGAVLGGASMALHHKLCHVLGGSFNLPHAETHAVMLPHTVGFNAHAAAAQLAPLAEIFGGSPGQVLQDFSRSLMAPAALRDLGMAETDLDRAADIAVQAPYPNPRPIERVAIRALLQDAWAGNRPPA